MGKIFLVEDDDNIRKLVCYALSREGYETEGFAAPDEFWSKYGKEDPNLVLLDIMLPQEDGLSILKKIRASNRNTAVIMLTARDSEVDKGTGLDLGADDYIAKPFGMSELVSRINAVLRRCGRSSEDEKVYRIGGAAGYPPRGIAGVFREEGLLFFQEVVGVFKNLLS